MKIVRVDDVEWFGASAHRGQGVNFKRLLSGEELTPNNFEFSLATVETLYETPRHRHNFDQVRFLLEGSFGYDRGLEQSAGTIGYFPEGTYYQQRGEGYSNTLLLQVANGSKTPYMSYKKLRESVAEMITKGVGEFENGVFTGYKNGKKFNQDGFEAVWEYVTGDSVQYSKKRYDQPIIMTPDNFSYCTYEEFDGAQAKSLGVFTERLLEIGFIKLAAGTECDLNRDKGRDKIYFALSGTGKIADESWEGGSAFHVRGVDGPTVIESELAAELYYVKLPVRV